MIIKHNVSDQVFNELKKNIETGIWKQGESIPSENELTEIYNVSRISVRNAIQRLVSLGWIETQQGKRAFVKEKKLKDIINTDLPMIILDNDELLKVIEFRRIIEVESVVLAAKNATEDNIKNLKSYIDLMDQLNSEDPEFSVNDLSFHIEIGRATQNELIVMVLKLLKKTLINNVETLNKLTSQDKGRIELHKDIFDAIINKDCQRAKEAMIKHMDYNLDFIHDKKHS